jgi:hypothetical protein
MSKLDFKELNAIANIFGRYVIDQSKQNLVNAKKGGGNLEKGLSYKVSDIAEGIKVTFEMPQYGEFVDRGVDGKKVKYGAKAYDGRSLAYTNKMPPPSKLDKWIVKRGGKGVSLAPRDSKGRFTKRKIDSIGFQKSIQFLIARSIFFKGIRPSMFFTTPYRVAMSKYTEQFSVAFFTDVKTYLNLKK